MAGSAVTILAQPGDNASALDDADRTKIFEGNARRVFSRLQA